MTNLAVAARDLRSGIRRTDIWLTLAWFDIKLRYRRTMIGPFWLPLSSVISITLMGMVYAQLLGMKLQDYFPYLAAGLALWSLIASFANEAPTVFVSSANLAHQTPLPFSLYVLRRVANAVFQFLHTWVSFWAVALYFGVPLGLSTLQVIPGILMLAVFGFWLTLAVGSVCLRYRDLGQAMTVVTQLFFFMTPIFYRVESLGKLQWIAMYNPVYHLVEICRAPLLGQPIPWASWGAACLINVLGCAVAFAIFARCRKRLAYWM
ncbi:MAG: ABC transporter permease [Planctomycetia bacterium]|nr:ABC transporter permease [Planctomycetia bacterium]